MIEFIGFMELTRKQYCVSCVCGLSSLSGRSVCLTARFSGRSRICGFVLAIVVRFIPRRLVVDALEFVLDFSAE